MPPWESLQLPTHQKSRHILVVDDEPGVRELLRNCFEMDGFSVSEAENGRQVQEFLETGTVDLITLDLNLGGENGFDLVRDIRAVHNVPIVMITGKGDTIDRVVGLELGADDYIAKPFQLREVVARVRAVLRRYYTSGDTHARIQAPALPGPGETATEEVYQFGDLTLNIPRRQLCLGDSSIRELTTAEFDLLAAFVQRARRVLSRDNIMDLLKGHEWSPMDRSIDALIVRLRRKIEPDPTSPIYIKTVRGVGYVFVADVRKSATAIDRG